MTILLAGILAMTIGTWLGVPTLTPILVGAVIGVAQASRPARNAAVAAFLSWAGLLAFARLRGDALGSLSSTLGAGMGIPGWVLFVATVFYPVILASSVAWLAHLVALRVARARSTGAAS